VRLKNIHKNDLIKMRDLIKRGGKFMNKETMLHSSVQNIIKEANNLNKELCKKTMEIEELSNKLIIECFEHDLCTHIDKARALVEENRSLKAENEGLKKRKVIIDSIAELIKEARSNEKERVELTYEQISELHESGLTAYKIGQLDGTGQQTVINKLKKMNEWQKKEIGVLSIPLCADFYPHAEVTRQFGILREGPPVPGIPERAAFVVDKSGSITFAKVYPLDQVPDVEELLRAAAEAR
jgi:hypothetical protein